MEFQLEFETAVLATIRECFPLVHDHRNFELLLIKLEGLHSAVSMTCGDYEFSWTNRVLLTIENIIQILVNEIESPSLVEVRKVGRPTIQISISTIEYLLSVRFKVTDISKFFGVSTDTIFRRMRDHGITVHSTYTNISDSDLQLKVMGVLVSFPNTGYKRMKGFLMETGVKVTDLRVREVMREVDPAGVHLRTLSNRAIVRRQYYVEYFNELWHLDTNMKLIRWNIVIRSCIDGKSRMVVYLDASGDNTAESNVVSFLKAVTDYGIPSRTRSDKGGENVLIAQFMIEQRGISRSSHICGRSVHNQRIERFWRDVFTGYTGAMYNMFSKLEEDGILDVDNPKHIKLLHLIFIPRINACLEVFRNSWNNHPLSTENNYSPHQLMIMTMPPADYDMMLTEDQLRDVNFVCNNVDDVPMLVSQHQETLIAPSILNDCLSHEELGRLDNINIQRESNLLGYDIFIEAVNCIT